MAVDEAVGRLIDTLRTTGELDNTLILFTSDNGFMLGEHRYNGRKYFPYDPSTRVPLLMRGPGIPKGMTSAARVLNPDLTATIVEASRSSPGRTLDGRSLLPLGRDPQATPPRPLLFEGSPLGDLTEDPEYTAETPDLDRRSSGYVAVRSANWLWIAYERGGRELYDLKADPDQINSRATDPTLEGLRQELQRLLVNLRQCQGEDCWNVPAGP